MKIIYLSLLLCSVVPLFAKEMKVTIDNLSVIYEIEYIETPNPRRAVSQGYSEFNGFIYRTSFDVPFSILKKITFVRDGTAISLPTSGLADCLGKDQILLPGHFHRELIGGGMERFSVYFAKGGAEDYVATWIVGGKVAIFESHFFCGDAPPKWYK